MNIGILGTGKVAHALGGAWRKAGHEVLLGGRTPRADEAEFDVVDLNAVVAFGDVIVNAITGAVALDAITALDATAMAGKTLLDTTNAVGATGELVYPNSSLAEHLQAALPDVRVVKSLNTAAIEVQADPSLAGPATVFVSGNDADAKQQVVGLLHDLGWEDDGILDLGGVQTARGPENYIVLFFAAIGVLKSPFFNLRISQK